MPAASHESLSVDRASNLDAARVWTAERARLARELDERLRELCRAEALARLTLGRIGREILKHHRYQRLGFVRVHDYTTERLGIAGRTLESAALVATRLETLPPVGAAFERGELSWTHVRLVCAIATPETAAAWVDRARGRRTDELAAMIDTARGGTNSHIATEIDDDVIDGEASVRVRIACPARLRVLWRYALDLASRMAGSHLPTWRCAELIAAEGIAGRPPDAAIGDRVMLAWMRLWRLRRRPTDSVGNQSGAGDSDARTSTAARIATAGARDVTTGAGEAVAPPIPLLDRRTTDGCDPFVLDARLRAAIQVIRGIEPRIGALLRTVVELRCYRSLGFHSTNDYVRDRLGISARKAWALVKIDRQARRAPEYADAYASGTLSWSRTLALLPVIDRHNAAAWVTRANSVTVRELLAAVNHALDRRDTLGDHVALDPPPYDTMTVDHRVQIRAHHSNPPAWTQNVTASTAEVFDAEIGFAGPATVVALFRDALDAYRPPGAPLSTALERLLRAVIKDWEAEPRHDDPVFARDGCRCSVPGCGARRELHDHHLRFRSKGGSNDLTNRVSICAAHHLRGIHRGVLRAEGTAPLDVHWQLGVRDGKPPLLAFVGDRYDGCSPR